MSDIEKAIELQRKDIRARAIAHSVVARVMHEHGPVNPENAKREAHEIAIKVAALMIQQLYDGDAEIVALRAQLALYRERCESLLNVMPAPPIVIVNPKKEQPE